MNEVETRKKLREWICKRSKKAVSPADLKDDTPVIESGLLSSLDIAEFVLFIESLRGSEVDVDDLEPDVFTNVNTMWQALFAPLA
jgi:acyl carrier protein